MSRKWEHDGDDARIAPCGSVRVGYDADTQTYTYRHPNGDYYEGPPGSEYGPLRLVSSRRPQTTSATTPRAAQPPAYPSPDSSPPPYSPSGQNTPNISRPQTSRRPPAVTFDEIFSRQSMEDSTGVSRSTDRELPSAPVAHKGPGRSLSLRSIFGGRRRTSSAEEGSEQLPRRGLGRSATTREPFSRK